MTSMRAAEVGDHIAHRNSTDYPPFILRFAGVQRVQLGAGRRVDRR
jgi:hypothetical protein